MTHFNPIGPLNGLGSPITEPGIPAPAPPPLTHPYDLAAYALGPVMFYQLEDEEWGGYNRSGSTPALTVVEGMSEDPIGSSGMTGLMSPVASTIARISDAPAAPPIIGLDQTVSMLVKMPDDLGMGYYGILNFVNFGGFGGMRRPIGLSNSWLPKDTDKGLSLSWTNSSVVGQDGSLAISAGWHHVVASISEHIDGLAADCKVWIDGELEFDDEMEQSGPPSTDPYATVINVGSQAFTYLGDNEIAGHGASRLTVYDKVLTDQQVSDLYDATGLGA